MYCKRGIDCKCGIDCKRGIYCDLSITANDTGCDNNRMGRVTYRLTKIHINKTDVLITLLSNSL